MIGERSGRATGSAEPLGFIHQAKPLAVLGIQHMLAPGEITKDHIGIGVATAGIDTVQVAAGTYVENITLDKNLILRGAQAGVPGCDRVASETVIAPTSGVGLTLTTGGEPPPRDAQRGGPGGPGGRQREPRSINIKPVETK